ncbi:hypothetical protein [Ralstonia pseudosolanacearum]|uniref:hypothetical protein n=1 Tax=Ralstonia pseudosolanacearum TaxID=1310165 RepID=UPI0018D1B34F|nr:hypothetical protein [Ralstonia pseudosolanacearum]
MNNPTIEKSIWERTPSAGGMAAVRGSVLLARPLEEKGRLYPRATDKSLISVRFWRQAISPGRVRFRPSAWCERSLIVMPPARGARVELP